LHRAEVWEAPSHSEDLRRAEVWEAEVRSHSEDLHRAEVWEAAKRIAPRLRVTDSDAELKRGVQSLLNKICPENVRTIASNIVETEVANTAELELVVGLIMKKVLAESQYCETYADLVFCLKTEMPEFPASDGGMPVSFKSTLINFCQSEFETMLQTDSLELTEEETKGLEADEIQFKLSARKQRILANMKFIGHLFLRQLLTARIIGSVMQDLAMCNEADKLPPEHVLECITELLNNIGYTLDSMSAGKEAIKQVCGRLMDLKQKKDKKGAGCYSKRIQFKIQDLLDTKNAGWVMKTFKATAKTKDEIKQDAARDAASGKAPDGSEHVIAGARPSYIASGAGLAGGKDDTGAWEVIPTKKR